MWCLCLTTYQNEKKSCPRAQAISTLARAHVRAFLLFLYISSFATLDRTSFFSGLKVYVYFVCVWSLFKYFYKINYNITLNFLKYVKKIPHPSQRLQPVCPVDKKEKCRERAELMFFFLLVADAAGCCCAGDAVNAPLSSESCSPPVRGVGLFFFLSSRKWISKFDHNNAFLFCFSSWFCICCFLLACLLVNFASSFVSLFCFTQPSIFILRL